MANNKPTDKRNRIARFFIPIETKKEKISDKLDINYTKSFLRICFVMLIITILYGMALWLLWLPFSDNTEGVTRGTFGDMYGALNSLFSGVTLAGVIITIIMQMKELELTRSELRKSAEAQNETQQALKDQLKSMQIASKIAIMESIITKNSLHPNAREVIIAQAIIEKESLKIFMLKENLNLFEPRIRATQHNVIGVDSNGNPNMNLDLINNSHPCTLQSSFVDKSSVVFSHNGSFFSPNKSVEFILMPNGETDFELTLHLRSEGVLHEWIQKVKIKLFNKSIGVHFEKPELSKLDEFKT